MGELDLGDHSFLPPETGFAQTAIDRLPLPGDATQLIAFFQQDRPQLDENSIFHPALKPPMNRAVIAKHLGQMIPLAPGTHPEDDAVDGIAKVNTASTGRLRWIGFGQNRLQTFPGERGSFDKGRSNL